MSHGKSPKAKRDSRRSTSENEPLEQREILSFGDLRLTHKHEPSDDAERVRPEDADEVEE